MKNLVIENNSISGISVIGHFPASTKPATAATSAAPAKFITPMIANGKVFIGTTNGVAVFGLLP